MEVGSVYLKWLAIGGSWAAILTVVIAYFGYGKFLWDRRRRRLRLEEYLKNEKANKKDKGQRSILHLVAHLGMTDAEILQASFQSNHVARRLGKDKQTGMASAILFEWTE